MNFPSWLKLEPSPAIAMQNTQDYLEQSPQMQQEEMAQCITNLKNKRMCDEQKSKRKAFIQNLRKQICHTNDEQPPINQVGFNPSANGNPDIFSKIGMPQSTTANQISPFPPKQYPDAMSIFQSNANFTQPLFQQQQQFPQGQQFFQQSQQTLISEQQPFTKDQVTFSAKSVLELISQVYASNGNRKLTVKDSRDLMHQLTILRTKFQQQPGISLEAFCENSDGSSSINDNTANTSIQLLDSLCFVVSCTNLFTMDIVLESIWILSNNSGSENLSNRAVEIYEKHANTFLSLITWCIALVNQQQASTLLIKTIHLIGNVSLESETFTQAILQKTVETLQTTILYMRNSTLILVSIWLLGIFYRNARFFYMNEKFTKNISFLLKRFRDNSRVIQELLWYLTSISQDAQEDLYCMYFDKPVVLQLISIVLLSNHTGNSIQALTLLSNAITMLSSDRIAYFQNIVMKVIPEMQNDSGNTVDANTNINNNNNEVCWVNTEAHNCSQNTKSVLNGMLEKVMSGNIVEFQREFFVFLSNIAVVFPYAIVQNAMFFDSILNVFAEGNPVLFVDLCYLVSNLIHQIPQSQQLAQQHPKIITILQAIINNQNIVNTYLTEIPNVLSFFSQFISSIS